jgi:hypothetical protein
VSSPQWPTRQRRVIAQRIRQARREARPWRTESFVATGQRAPRSRSLTTVLPIWPKSRPVPDPTFARLVPC